MQQVDYTQLKALLSGSGGKKVFVIAFGSDCGQCKMMQPVIRKVMGKVGDSVIFAAINAPENMDFSREHSVRQLPTMLVFDNGDVAATFHGFTPESQLLKALGSESGRCS